MVETPHISFEHLHGNANNFALLDCNGMEKPYRYGRSCKKIDDIALFSKEICPGHWATYFEHHESMIHARTNKF